jgi:peptide/nickel transport system substrate-binding protein
LDTPIGPGQYAYTPNVEPKYTYDPQKAKDLVKEAGFPDGVDVELSTPVNMYTKDKEITQAMVPMLNAVGIRTKLLAPEWSTLWANVQTGKVPFFYMGRGQVRDPGQPLSQYFETKLLADVMARIQEEAPAAFMWRYKLLWGVASNLQWEPRSDEGIYAHEIKLK